MRISQTVMDAVVGHARDAAPHEACGLLLGDAAAVVDSVRTPNLAASPATRFVIDPAAHLAGRREARRRGLEVVGFYHSHPATAPYPSETDLAEAAYEGSLYLIVGLAADEAQVRLFRLGAREFEECPFSVGQYASPGPG